MSSTSVTAGLSSEPNKTYKNSFHWRNDSGELDVFEAARYFSGAGNDQAAAAAAVPAAYINFIREDRRHHAAARRSLDVPIMRSNPINPSDYHNIIDQKQLKEPNKMKLKQPSSPGGRIASFLNSLFNQTSLKKKKKSKTGKDFEEESSGTAGGRRKRRSSISHFRITSTTKNAATDKGSGFRTPPPYANTPTKSYKELARFAANHHAVCLKAGGLNLEEKKLRVSEKMLKINIGNLEKMEVEDDGAESDSSSDLFDLPNHDLDFFSSGLPVYESTHMERIRIATPISSAT
ncbi:hypothetical protein C2S51_033614 [Perilla frutescens var. frutescens]|nr:hypothetical protein C2S51_033614 [Perilla frutescens var. frutescens]